jgi:hypothetical protein
LCFRPGLDLFSAICSSPRIERRCRPRLTNMICLHLLHTSGGVWLAPLGFHVAGR